MSRQSFDDYNFGGSYETQKNNRCCVLYLYCCCDKYFLECDWPRSDTVQLFKASTSSIAKVATMMISQSMQEGTKALNERVALAA